MTSPGNKLSTSKQIYYLSMSIQEDGALDQSLKNVSLGKEHFDSIEKEDKGVFHQDKDSCSIKMKRKFEQLTDTLANFLECTRLFQKDRLQQLKQIAKNQSDDEIENESTKSVPSNISKMSTNEDLKSEASQNNLNCQQLPLRNYGMCSVNKIRKRYVEDFSKSYSERRTMFKKKFDQINLEREEEHQRKAKNCWAELIRLLFCYGGTYLDEADEDNATSEAISNSEVLRKRAEPILQRNFRHSQQNLFLAESLIINDVNGTPPVEIKLPINQKRKVRGVIKVLNEYGAEVNNQTNIVEEDSIYGVGKRTKQQVRKEVEQRGETQYEYVQMQSLNSKLTKNQSESLVITKANEMHEGNIFESFGEQLHREDILEDPIQQSSNQSHFFYSINPPERVTGHHYSTPKNYTQQMNSNINFHTNDLDKDKFNERILNQATENEQRTLNERSVNHIIAINGNTLNEQYRAANELDNYNMMANQHSPQSKKERKQRKPMISKTEGLTNADDFKVSQQEQEGNTLNLFRESVKEKNHLEFETIEDMEMRQQSKKRKNKKKGNLVIVNNRNIEEELQIDDI